MSSDHYRDALERLADDFEARRDRLMESPADICSAAFDAAMLAVLDAVAATDALAQAEEDVEGAGSEALHGERQSPVSSTSPEPASCVPVGELEKLRDEFMARWAEEKKTPPPRRLIGLWEELTGELDSLIASAVPCGEERLREALEMAQDHVHDEYCCSPDAQGPHGAVETAIRTALSQQHTEE